MIFLEEMEKLSAFRSTNGEYGWTQGQVAEVIAILGRHFLAILGGELWLVEEGSHTWTGLIPQREGTDAVYARETKRYPNETWITFVNRCIADSKAAVEEWPDQDTLPPDLPGRILYNLTWISEEEYESGNRAV